VSGEQKKKKKREEDGHNRLFPKSVQAAYGQGKGRKEKEGSLNEAIVHGAHGQEKAFTFVPYLLFRLSSLQKEEKRREIGLWPTAS